MSTTDAPLSQTIEGVAGALAQFVVEQHAERDPGLSEKYGRDWRGRWAADVRTRIGHLAVAAELGQASLFSEYLTWSMSAAQARGVGADDFRTSVRCLRDVIAAHLPEAASRECLRCLDASAPALEAAPMEPESALNRSSPRYELSLRFLEAALSGRGREAERLLIEAAESGAPVSELYAEAIQPALREVGRLWQIGECTVADEHAVTAVAERAMARLRSHFPSSRSRGRTVLATAVSGDLHSVGVRMVADAFEMDGWDAVFLGANTPAADIVSAMAVGRVDLLAASASGIPHLAGLVELIGAVRRDQRVARTPIIVGGAPFVAAPDLWRRVGADGAAATAREAVEQGNTLVGAD